MAQNPFQQKIQAYNDWKNNLIEAIKHLSQWMDAQDLEQDSEISLRIYEAIEALKKDRLNLAFVAEFSRGKSELINAIFFADYKRRLLPSDAGRTTMCPTELFYDHESDSAYLQLLSIDTRLAELSIQEYKEDPIQWTKIPLPIDDPDEMQNILQEIIQTREVTITRATELGLFSKELYPHLENANPDDTVIDIPTWRHAMISFPHPLLKQGLSILDTPGLNALGSEPELTLNMLPSAQAIFFLLAADTGVTHSDLDIWQNHVSPSRRKNAKGVAVILNKIDTLWDELKSKQEIDKSINEQINKTSQILGVDKNTIFPVSAQKGLLAKINEDELLMHRSQLEQLEKYLSDEVLPERESILRDDIIDNIGSILEEHKATFETRLAGLNKQLNDLRQLNGKNSNVIMQLMKRAREEQADYSKHIEGYKSSHRLLTRQVTGLKNILNIRKMDEFINNTRQSMMGSWTTNGMKKSMKDLFNQIQDMSSRASEDVDTLQRLVTAVYKKFHNEHGIKTAKPKMFKVKKYLIELDSLTIEAEQYRKSPVSTMSEQNFVVKRFFIQMVSKARNAMFEANEDLDNWLKESMRPLAIQIKENKLSIEKRLNTLRKISSVKGNVEAKTAEVEEEHANTLFQLDEINQIYLRLTHVESQEIQNDDQPQIAG